MRKKTMRDKAFLSFVEIWISVKIYRFITKMITKYVFTYTHVLFQPSFLVPSPYSSQMHQPSSRTLEYPLLRC